MTYFICQVKILTQSVVHVLKLVPTSQIAYLILALTINSFVDEIVGHGMLKSYIFITQLTGSHSNLVFNL